MYFYLHALHLLSIFYTMLRCVSSINKPDDDNDDTQANGVQIAIGNLLHSYVVHSASVVLVYGKFTPHYYHNNARSIRM